MGKLVAVAFTFFALTLVMAFGMLPSSQPGGKALAQPPAEPTEYVGLTKCAACHFQQYKDWQASPHEKAYEILPTKYRTNAECLKCHTTGFGHGTVEKAVGISCEACHGPGGEHAKMALRFVNERITEEGLTELRSKIHRIDYKQCIECHVSAAHKKHPEFDRDGTTKTSTSRSSSTASSLFNFSNVHGKRTGS